MKKIFLFALAAAAITVACQKNQEATVDHVNDGNLVEIKFSTNVAVETKAAVTSLDGLDLYVYGLNITKDGKREIINEPATCSAPASVTGETTADLTLTAGPFYYNGNSDQYDFYGYYLGGLTPAAPFDKTNVSADITIDGTNDILLAKALSADAGTADGYCGKSARANVHPNLKFEHVLSQFKFAAINLGGNEMSLSAITVETPVTGTVTVAGTSAGVVGKDDEGTIPVAMDELTLTSKSTVTDPQESDYDKVVSDASESNVMVFPDVDYNLLLTVKQGTETRTLRVAVTDDIVAGHSYLFQIKLYSLEEVKITASLVDWTVETINLDTGNAEEVE